MTKALRFEKPSGRSASLAVTCVLFDSDASRFEDAAHASALRRRRSQLDKDVFYDAISTPYASSASVDAKRTPPPCVDATYPAPTSTPDVRQHEVKGHRIGSGLAYRHESFMQAVSKSSTPYHPTYGIIIVN